MFCGLCFPKKRSVDTLDYSHQNLLEVPAEVYQSKRTLQRLYLNTNHIRDLPKGLGRFEELEELDISENDLVFLPPSIGQLLYLRELNVSKNGLPNIPEAIQHCQELVTANFSGNPVGRIPEGLTLARQLQHLSLNECDLDQLPPNFGRLCKLESLDLRENHLLNLPISLGHLVLLERLDIGVNEIEELPNVIGQLESLLELWVDNNPLAFLPNEVGQLHNLRFLELSECKLEELPESIGYLASLTDLYLQENLLSELPESFGMLQNLVNCRLDTNRLVKLPNSIGGLQNLIELNLSYNHISEIPPSVGNLVKLKTFIMDENLLYLLPEEIGCWCSITVLSVRNNKLIELPSSIGQLQQLTILNVVGNRLQELPISVRGMQSLVALWITENQGRPLLEFQVEEGEDGGKWLTCILFPQQGPQTPYDGSGSASHSESSMVQTNVLERQPSKVNFDPRVPERKPSKVLREPTPYHKDLHSKVKQWRATREIVEANGEVRVRTTTTQKSKLGRPHSLLRALNNPVQDENGLIHIDASSRSSTLSPDLLMHLPSHGVSENNEGPLEEEKEEEEGGREDGADAVVTSTASPSALPQQRSVRSESPTPSPTYSPSPQTPSSPLLPQPDLLVLQNNNNNNNGTSVEDSTNPGALYLVSKVLAEPPDTSPQPRGRFSSTESGFEADTEQDFNTPTPSGDCVTPATAWYLSSSSSPYHVPISNTSLTDKGSEPSTICLSPLHEPLSPPATLSPETEAVPPQQSGHLPTSSLSVQLPPPMVVSPSFSSSTSSHTTASSKSEWYNQALTSYPRHNRNKPISAHPHYYASPDTRNLTWLPQETAQTRRHDVGGSRSKMEDWHDRVAQQREGTKEQDFAMEHTLQSCQQPQLVMSDEGLPHLRASSPLPFSPVSTGSVGGLPEHSATSIPVQRKRVRRGFERYVSDDSNYSSGVDTPDCFRGHTKSLASVTSGNDSGLENTLPKTSSSAGILDKPHSSSPVSKLFKVVLDKNPTLGLGITGGIDGENALYPGDKSFHVYKIVRGMPAAKSGKIREGDKIVQVNGVYVANLHTNQLVRLLTGPEPFVTLLLVRESRITLL